MLILILHPAFFLSSKLAPTPPPLTSAMIRSQVLPGTQKKKDSGIGKEGGIPVLVG
jgi:hypothetical protein